MTEFDLDGFIGETADFFRDKHPVDDSPGKRIQRQFDRAKHDRQAADTIARARNPKLPLRDGAPLWTPPPR